MRTVLQRVSSAKVSVDGSTVGEIESGLCILVGIGPDDTREVVSKMADKILGLRIFSDDAGKMNRSIVDVGGAVLAVSQFTLFADCRKGRRPSFVGAAPPDLGRELYEYFAEHIKSAGVSVATGIFGADMMVEIHNDGPVTILLDSSELSA